MRNLDEWKRIATPQERVEHSRQNRGAVSSPAHRISELTSEVHAARRCLVEATSYVEHLELQASRYHSFEGSSFGGIPMAQHLVDLVLWEALLNENRQLKAIVELGTWEGGFSWWLWGQASARNLTFKTFDSIQPKTEPPNFTRLDIFAEAEALGEAMRSLEPLILFCDNGNKPREVKTFSAALRDRQSLIVAHDWGTEFLPTDVPESVVEAYGPFCDSIGSVSRVFRLRSDGGEG